MQQRGVEPLQSRPLSPFSEASDEERPLQAIEGFVRSLTTTVAELAQTVNYNHSEVTAQLSSIQRHLGIESGIGVSPSAPSGERVSPSGVGVSPSGVGFSPSQERHRTFSVLSVGERSYTESTSGTLDRANLSQGSLTRQRAPSMRQMQLNHIFPSLKLQREKSVRIRDPLPTLRGGARNPLSVGVPRPVRRSPTGTEPLPAANAHAAKEELPSPLQTETESLSRENTPKNTPELGSIPSPPGVSLPASPPTGLSLRKAKRRSVVMVEESTEEPVKVISRSFAGQPRRESMVKEAAQQRRESIAALSIAESFAAAPMIRAVCRYPEELIGDVPVSTLRPNSPGRCAWDMAYLALHMAECFMVLYDMGERRWEQTPSAGVAAVLAIATLFFFADIIVKATTAQLVGFELIDDSLSSVMRIYLRRWGKYDLAITIPWDLLLWPAGGVAFHVGNFVRLLRVPRIHWLFRSPNPLRRQLRFANLAFFAFYFTLLHHLVAVVWIALQNNEGQESSASERYESAMYWAIMTMTSVGYGDILPDNRTSRIWASVVMIVGVVQYAYVLGNVASWFSQEDFQQRLVREKRDRLASLMEHYAVPWPVQKQAFSVLPILLEGSKLDYADMLEGMPPFIQERIGWCVKLRLVRRVPMFAAEEPQMLLDLAGAMSNMVLEPGENVVNAGEHGSEMFFLAHGLVEIVRLGEDGEEIRLASLRDGSWFGEIALLKDTKRTATVRTLTQCDVFVLRRAEFLQLVSDHPETNLANEIVKEAQRRMAVQHLGDSGEKQHLSAGEIDRVVKAALESGDELKQGDFIRILGELGLRVDLCAVGDVFSSEPTVDSARLRAFLQEHSTSLTPSVGTPSTLHPVGTPIPEDESLTVEKSNTVLGTFSNFSQLLSFSPMTEKNSFRSRTFPLYACGTVDMDQAESDFSANLRDVCAVSSTRSVHLDDERAVRMESMRT
eukprot:Hpha_TRINITY_DN9263_c0_g2::TRINITY_DN9263_c0_g2_i1::g.28845::m.28845